MKELAAAVGTEAALKLFALNRRLVVGRPNAERKLRAVRQKWIPVFDKCRVDGECPITMNKVPVNRRIVKDKQLYDAKALRNYVVSQGRQGAVWPHTRRPISPADRDEIMRKGDVDLDPKLYQLFEPPSLWTTDNGTPIPSYMLPELIGKRSFPVYMSTRYRNRFNIVDIIRILFRETENAGRLFRKREIKMSYSRTEDEFYV